MSLEIMDAPTFDIHSKNPFPQQVFVTESIPNKGSPYSQLLTYSVPFPIGMLTTVYINILHYLLKLDKIFSEQFKYC